MSKLDKALSVMLWANILVFGFAGAQLIFHSHNYTAAVYCYLADIWVFAYILLRDSKRRNDRLLDNALAKWKSALISWELSINCHAALARRCADLVLALKRAAVKKREYLQMKRLADKYLRESDGKCQLDAVVGMTAGEIDEVVKCLKRYADTTEENYCCADCIEDIAKAVGFSFAQNKAKEAGK